MGDFITSITKVEGLIEERKQALVKIGSYIADAVTSRVREGKASKENIKNDVRKAIQNMSAEDQVEALLNTVADMAMAGKFKSDRPDRIGIPAESARYTASGKKKRPNTGSLFDN